MIIGVESWANHTEKSLFYTQSNLYFDYYEDSVKFGIEDNQSKVVVHLLILLFKWIKSSADTMIAVKRRELKLKLKKAKKESESTENDQTSQKTDDQKKTD